MLAEAREKKAEQLASDDADGGGDDSAEPISVG